MMIQTSASSPSLLLLTWLFILWPFHPSCGWVVLVRNRHHWHNYHGTTTAGTLKSSCDSAHHRHPLHIAPALRARPFPMRRPVMFGGNEKKQTLTMMSLHFSARDRDNNDEEESGERECQNDAKDDDGGDDDDIDDDEEQSANTAYGRKSLAWTNKFRTLFPYETARRSVMDLGLRHKDEWDEYVADGKPYHGPYLPNHPDQMYATEWESWDEFLGIIRPYDETRQIVQQVLRLRNMDEYVAFIESHRPRAEGLRIPAQPRLCYQHHGTWRSDEHFFGPEEEDD